MDRRFDKMDARFDKIDDRFDHLGTRIDAFTHSIIYVTVGLSLSMITGFIALATQL